MISFLVTYYNQEKYISRSLDSILNQNLNTEFEIIIGDDGSTDRTPEIIKSYQKKYPQNIKIITQERNNSVKELSVERASKNRLSLLLQSSGEYICFLDGDDSYCDFDFIQSSINELVNNKNIVGIAHNYVIIKKKGEKQYNPIVTKKKFISLNDYAKDMYIHVGAIIFRKPSFNELQSIRELQSFDDNDITYYFLNKGKLLYKNIYVYNYYSNDDGICSSVNDFEMKLLNAIDYYIIKQIINRSHFTLFVRYFESIYYVYLNRNLLKDAKYEKWIQWIQRMNIQCPFLIPNYNSIQLKMTDFKMFIEKLIVYAYKKKNNFIRRILHK